MLLYGKQPGETQTLSGVPLAADCVQHADDFVEQQMRSIELPPERRDVAEAAQRTGTRAIAGRKRLHWWSGEYDQRAMHGGQFLVKLRTAYSGHVVEAVRQRLRGSIRRTVEGGLESGSRSGSSGESDYAGAGIHAGSEDRPP
jgi:hypothetical protein